MPNLTPQLNVLFYIILFILFLITLFIINIDFLKYRNKYILRFKNFILLFIKEKGLNLRIGYAILGNINTIYTVYLLSYGLNLEIYFTNLLVLMPPVILISSVPISILGWGVRETVMSYTLSFVGIDTTSAVSVSFLFGFTILLSSIPGAFFLKIRDNF